MSKDGVDVGKRRFLTGATVVVGGVGAAFVATPFVKSWNPSAKARALGAPVEANISELEEGARITVVWRGKPVWVIRRTKAMLATLGEDVDELRDPECKEPQQPPYCQNEYRSIKPSILVMIGICTHLGCSPEYRPQADKGQLDYPGFFCPCHGSKYDISGRVYSGVPAPLNMVVPEYHYVNDNLIEVGVSPEQASQGAA